MARAVLALSATPNGFSALQVAEHVRRQTSASRQDYGPRQAAYDLRKFRGKELVQLAGKSRRYQPAPNGLRTISALMVLRERIIEPLISSAVNLQDAQPGLNLTPLDQRYLAIREQMHEVLRELRLAA